MKKLLALLLAAAMLLTFVACASKPAETQTPAETTTEETAAPAAETETKTEEAPAAETTDGKTYKVAMICDSSINDGGWGAACYNAMIAAAERKGWQAEVTDSISQDAYYDSIVAYCMLGYDMIYAPGNQYTDAVLQALRNIPTLRLRCSTAQLIRRKRLSTRTSPPCFRTHSRSAGSLAHWLA